MTLFAELGMRYPIIPGPHGGCAEQYPGDGGDQAGALGSCLPPCWWCRASPGAEPPAASGPGPFNINFFAIGSANWNRQQSSWRQVLSPYYTEFGVDAAAPSRAPARAPSMTSMRPCLQSSGLPWSASISACLSPSCLPR